MGRMLLATSTAFVLGLAFVPGLAAQSLSDLTINGYASFEFEKQIEDEGNGDPNGSFDADLFDLVLNFQVSDAIRVATDLTWEHGTATEEGFGNVAVEYAFIEYAASDLVKIRVGKMFTPYGIFNEIHTAKPAFLSVKEAASTNKTERIVENAFRFFPRWGAGIAVRGDGVIADRDFSYDVLLANGDQSDTNPFEEDNNGSKAITARFRFEPTATMMVGTSFYYDVAGAGGVDRLMSDGLEFRYQHEALQLLAEIAFGWLKPLEGDERFQVGWFIQPSYHFDNGVTPYGRFEWVDPDGDVPEDQGYDLILGVNLEISPGFMVKLENNYFKGAPMSTVAELPGSSYNEIKAAVVLGF